VRIALLELLADDKTATGERGRALRRYLDGQGHEVTVLSPDRRRLDDFPRLRYSLRSRLRRRALRLRSLPHLWDYIADEIEPRVRGTPFDVVIARGQTMGGVFTRGVPGLKVLDMANIAFLEMYHASGADALEVQATYEREQQIYASADWILAHHEILAEFFRRNVFDSPKVRTVRMGADAAQETASFASPPRIVYAGSYEYIQDPYLLSLLSRASPLPIDCYGSKDPNRTYLPHPLAYKGYEPSTRFLADYQLGLITVSQDRLRRHSPSTKFAYYFARGLPVLFPEWMLEGFTYDAAVPYDEGNFSRVVAETASDRARWESLSARALQTAASLSWDAVLAPLGSLLRETPRPSRA
jgi:glycosyl transferase family 4